jgi:hypothetical protein
MLTFNVQGQSPANIKNKTVKLKNPAVLTNVKRSKTSLASLGIKK